MSASALRRGPPPGEDGREALLWGGALAFALAIHVALGLAWLTRVPVGEAPEQLPAVIFDLAPPAASGVQGAPAPVVEPAPEVPLPEIPPDMPAEAAPTDPAPRVAASAPPVQPAPPPEPPSPVALPVVRPKPPKPPVRHEPSPAEQARAREKAREQTEARRKVEAARERAEEARRRASASRREQAAGASRSAPARPASASAGPASAAASAAWRSQIVGILRSRFAGGSSGMASVNFSVTRGGQIAGARLTSSSGNPRLDAAALAAFRGSVPPPPAGYVGALTFNIRLGVR